MTDYSEAIATIEAIELVNSNWRSGFVRRWHMNPDLAHVDDTTAAHQGRCGMLVLSIWPDSSRELIVAAVTHDAAEYTVGDLSRPFKDTGSPVVEQHAKLEAEQLKLMGFGQELSENDRIRLKFVDSLDCYLLAQLRAANVMTRDGWPEHKEMLISQSRDLGIHDVIAGLLS